MAVPIQTPEKTPLMKGIALIFFLTISIPTLHDPNNISLYNYLPSKNFIINGCEVEAP